MSVTHSEPFLQKFATLLDIFLPNPLLLVTIARLPPVHTYTVIQSTAPSTVQPTGKFPIQVVSYYDIVLPFVVFATTFADDSTPNGRTNERTTMKVSFLFRPHLPHPQSRCGGIEIKARIPLRMSGK